MKGIVRPRTHPVWKEIANMPAPPPFASKPKRFTQQQLDYLRSLAPANTPHLDSYMNQMAQEVFITPELEEAVTVFEKANDRSRRSQPLPPLNAWDREPDWVFWRKALDGEVDVDWLRNKYIDTEGSPQELQLAAEDRKQSVGLLKWYKQLTAELEELEKDRLNTELKEELASAEDFEEEELIKKYYGALLGRVSSDVKSKLKILAAIQASQPAINLGDETGVPPLPSREKLKEWYEVHLIESYFDETQKKKLATYQEVTAREFRRLSSFPCAKDHLQRNYEYEVFVAGNNEAAKDHAQEAYNLKREAYADWESTTFTPENSVLRWKDANAIKFLKSKGIRVPRTRRQVYEELDELDQEEWKRFFEFESHKRNALMLEDYRTRHADGPLNEAMNASDEIFERLHDFKQEVTQYYNTSLAAIDQSLEVVYAEIRDLQETTVQQVVVENPELEALIRRQISLHRWDPTISDADYERDVAHVEERKKIWWTPWKETHGSGAGSGGH